MSKVNFSDELKRDGFFAGEGVPYTYTAGDCGVELIEFLRHRAFGYDLQLGGQGRRPCQRLRACLGRHHSETERSSLSAAPQSYLFSAICRMNGCIQATHPIDWKTDYGRKAVGPHLSGNLNTMPSE